MRTRNQQPTTLTIDDLLEDAAADAAPSDRWPTGAAIIGLVRDVGHPSLPGRVRVSWVLDGASHEAWLPAVLGLAVRAEDRVLCTWPANWPEPIVTGVVDGFARRPKTAPVEAAALVLRPDESLTIADATGRSLVRISQAETGAVVTMSQADVSIETEGRLRLAAGSIDLEAREGEVRIAASDDVVVKGETINLN